MKEILIAGFGGQGILFAGKILAYGGMLSDKQVSWLPSYGPEMRGGTANCNVIISDELIGAPTINCPDILVVMNRPSLDKFENTVAGNGIIILDSSLIDSDVKRDDVVMCKIPATQMAHDINAPKLANMIILGALIKQTQILPLETIFEAVKKSVPPNKEQLYDINCKAIMAGYEY